jgi:hypothetical protein
MGHCQIVAVPFNVFDWRFFDRWNIDGRRRIIVAGVWITVTANRWKFVSSDKRAGIGFVQVGVSNYPFNAGTTFVPISVAI